MDEIGEALGRLRAFNRMVCRDPEIKKRLVDGPYDVLQWQQALLFQAFRDYRKRPQAALRAVRGAGRISPRRFSFGLAACALTAVTLLRGRIDALVFSVDKTSSKGERDFRIEGLYRFLETRRLRYAEAFHTVPGARLLRNAKSRKRAALYHEAFDFMGELRHRWSRRRPELSALAERLPCEAFQETDRPFIRALAFRTLLAAQRAPFVVRRCRQALSRLRPRVVLAIDDTRHYHALIEAARAERVPFYAFQHGLFTVSHVGWLDDGCGEVARKTRPDALIVWSDYWKRELLRLGSYFRGQDVRIGGNPKGETPDPPLPPTEGGAFGVLIPYESGAPKEDVSAHVRAFLADPSIRVFFSIRPDRDRAAQLAEYGLLPSERLTVVAGDLDAYLPGIHAVCGAYSTFLYDALAYRRPVFILETARTTGLAMVENGLAEFLPREQGVEALKRKTQEARARVEERARAYLGGGIALEETLDGLFKSV